MRKKEKKGEKDKKGEKERKREKKREKGRKRAKRRENKGEINDRLDFFGNSSILRMTVVPKM